jgi:hypothetical protein
VTERITPSRDLSVTIRPASTTTGQAGRIATVEIPADYSGQGDRAHRRMMRAATRALNGGTVGAPWPVYMGMTRQGEMFATLWGIIDPIEPEPWEGHPDQLVSDTELQRLIAENAAHR